MIYFKNKNDDVYAYPKQDLEQVDRLKELEKILTIKEPVFIEAQDNLFHAEVALNEAKSALEMEATKLPPNEDDSEWLIAHNEQLDGLKTIVEEKTVIYEERLIVFNQIESEYQPIKAEYDEILPVFFDIRDNLNISKKMSQKEIDAHLNPLIPKEQLIAEAEQQKQSLLAEANNAIAPLQDAVDLDMATDEEIAQSMEWKKYRVLLNRVDTSTAPDIEWPEKPNAQ